MKFQDIPKFVVNLETRPDNLELIKKEMDYMGWEFEKFNAITRDFKIRSTRISSMFASRTSV
jgi:hypothetical protein